MPHVAKQEGPELRVSKDRYRLGHTDWVISDLILTKVLLSNL